MSAGDLADDERDQIGRSSARDEVWMLTLIGVALVVISGIGVWFTRFEAVQFDTVEMPDDRTVIVWHGCNGSYRSEVWEREDEVEISLAHRPPRDDQDCLSSFRIELDEPLGDRAIVDHRTGRTAILVPYSG